jgi:hypothetical protein
MASMSILDDAIREHLELKRAHGADEAELKKLEDEAFGPPASSDEPDPFAEAQTEFLAAPQEGGTEEGDSGRRRINVADLQEAPEPPSAPAEPAEPEADAGPSTEERHAIAEQPTEHFDVEGEIEPAADAPSPSDEEIVDAELSEPRLAPVDPETEIHASASDPEIAEEPEEEVEEDDFFSEQRLSDELDQALEAPLTEEHPIPAEEEGEEDEAEYEDEDAPENDEDEEAHEDVLEDTPDFLEDAPEDDELWFEQRPPKDFDFDD